MYKEEKIVELIIKSFSGDISTEESVMIKTWVSENPQNRNYYNELINVWQVSHPAFSPDLINTDKAESKVMGQIHDKKLINTSVFVWWQRVAAVLIIPVAMLLGYMLYQQTFRSTVTAYQEVSAPNGMSSKVNLPDGSTVWLNSGSKLKYPVVFAAAERNVYLSGEGFFKVHSDKKHPFIVNTEKLNVMATGTQFNVEAYSSDSVSAVTLVEGKLDVQIGRSVSEKLLPNQRIVLNSNTNTYDMTNTDAKHWGMWKDGILAFRGESLEEVFKRIGRTFNVDIKVKDPVIARQLYRATFEGESLDEILRLLKMSAPIKYMRSVREKQTDGEFNKEKIEVFKVN
jgi:transmembrane sensor